MFMESRLIRHFPEGIAGYVEGKCVLRYRQKLESSQIVYKRGFRQNSKCSVAYQMDIW